MIMGLSREGVENVVEAAAMQATCPEPEPELVQVHAAD
jgi:hypothetical protein